MTHNFARDERSALCDLLDGLGPEQPTLCTGWTTRDLAAHLIVRERRPLAAPGIAVRPLAGYTARVQRRVAERPFPELVATVRRPPRWSPYAIAAVDRAVNTLEMFIHHEDIRRAQPDWEPRELSPAFARTLWTLMRRLARLRLRRFPAAVVVEAWGHGEVRTGRGGEQVRVSGAPGELAVFLTGRQPAARVELTGPAALTDRLATTQLGL